ncbi:MAG: hypothetical protein NTW79_02780 [Candidatus Berkelbacteria bacterium]|nr:hypothetical protein [Candidatus Berkelbacteria bacterium]
MKKNRIQNLFIGIGIAGIIAILGWFFYQNSTSKKNLATINAGSFKNNSFSYSVNFSDKENQNYDLTIAEIPLKNLPPERQIYFYFDQNYPFVGTTLGNTIGAYNHLLSEFQIKNLDQNIKLVDSNSLVDALADKNSIIIMANGVLPETIYSPNHDLITPWINSGGNLIWAGDGIGYYYGVRGVNITSDNSPSKIGWTGAEKILGTNYLDGPIVDKIEDSLGDTPSFLAQVLGIRSKYTRTGGLESAILKTNNLDLGYDYNFPIDSRNSLSEISVGNGKVFLFGSVLMNREVDVAWDISQIIGSGVIDADVAKINFKNISLSSGDEENVSRQVNVGVNSHARIMIFSTDSEKKFFISRDFQK